MTADQDKRDVAARFIHGLLDGDWDRMRSALTDDATWSLPGTTAVSGLAEGADAVVERGRAIVSGGVSIELLHILTGEHNAAVMLHNTGRRGDAVLDEHLTTVFTLRDGRIAALETLISDVAMLDAFFAASS